MIDTLRLQKVDNLQTVRIVNSCSLEEAKVDWINVAQNLAVKSAMILGKFLDGLSAYQHLKNDFSVQ